MSTLTINFTTAVIPPPFGYKIKYWNTTTPATILTTTVTTSPATITGLTGTSYAGTVEAMCNTEGGSTPQPFTATVSGPTTATLKFVTFECNQAAFTLSSPLTVPFTVTGFGASGFSNTTCSTATNPAVSTILNAPTTVPANSSFFTLTMIEFGPTILSYRPEPFITINGVVVLNGGTFSAGGTIVTVSIPTACVTYTNCNAA